MTCVKYWKKSVGGPHGKYFSDYDRVSPNTNITEISIHYDKRIDGVGLVAVNLGDEPITMFHEGNGGVNHVFTLHPNEYIQKVKFHWYRVWKIKIRLSIFYMKFTTNENRTFEGGTKAEFSKTFKARDIVPALEFIRIQILETSLQTG